MSEHGMAMDLSNGWDTVADDLIRSREAWPVGALTVRQWSLSLPQNATVLDLGCGFGVPISQTLIEAGCRVFGIDASPRLVEEFRERFPGVPVACERVEESRFFDLQFDAAVSWGLMFLLEPNTQRELIRRVSNVLPAGARFLFTAPRQACTWQDISTRQQSVSLGWDRYKAYLASCGFDLLADHVDEGDNYYYDAVRR